MAGLYQPICRIARPDPGSPALVGNNRWGWCWCVTLRDQLPSRLRPIGTVIAVGPIGLFERMDEQRYEVFTELPR